MPSATSAPSSALSSFRAIGSQRRRQCRDKILPVQHVLTFRVLKLVRDQNTSDNDVESLLRRDVALSYKLLRMVNSAAFGGRGIWSIGHALRLLGREQVGRWLALLLVTDTGREGVRAELMHQALVRGRLCELLAEASGIPRAAGPLFLVGILSPLDQLLETPMESLVAQMELAPDVCRRASAPRGFLRSCSGYGRSLRDGLVGRGRDARRHRRGGAARGGLALSGRPGLGLRAPTPPRRNTPSIRPRGSGNARHTPHATPSVFTDGPIARAIRAVHTRSSRVLSGESPCVSPLAATLPMFPHRPLFALATTVVSVLCHRQSAHAQRGPGVAGDFVIHNFTFVSGEALPELRMHYVTLGQPRRDAAGVVRNAVLLLHGTGGTGAALVRPFMPLFVPGGLLDTSKFYIIFPDGIGHGGSSKPSDGLHMKFPKYTYDDMVAAQHALLVDGLKVTHLYLLMGTSMGCMHAWVWGERYPDFANGLVPLACTPTAIAGRNRMMRKMIIDDIEQDPAWKGGEYGSAEPTHGLRAAAGILFLMGSAPLVQQKAGPTRAAADSSIMSYLDREQQTLDANDMIYQFDASRDYNPSAHLEAITAPVLAINSADDEINPPDLGIVGPLVGRVAHAKFVLIPTSDQTRGHGTHSAPNVWKNYLADFLATLPKP